VSVLIWLILLVVAGLGGAEPVDGVARDTAPPVPTSVPADATDEEIEWWFVNRPEYPTCGSLDGRHLPWDVAGAWHCLQRGIGAEGAELVVRHDDAEPRRQTYYRLTPDGRLEIVTHVERAATEVARSWRHRECTPSPDLQARPCA
jgi:hypothetical protein